MLPIGIHSGETTMNINSKHVAAILAASAMSFGLTASAQPGPGAGKGPGMGPDGGCPMVGGQMMGDPAARAEQHLNQFKSQLKITPQQEPLWQAFADKVKESAGMRAKAMQGMQTPPATAPERMNRMLEHMKQHTAAMEAVNDSFKRLYDALTPEQKATADKYQPFGGHMGPKHGGKGRQGGMGPQGGMGGPQGQAATPAPR
jgi:hypothetical protein